MIGRPIRLALEALLLVLVLLLAWNAVNPRPSLPAADAGDGSAGGRRLPPPDPIEALSLKHYPGRIADDAGAVGLYVATLERSLAQWPEDLGIDFHVASVNAPEHPASELAVNVFESRKVGADAPTGGLLLLLNPAREEARIEVSYSLEGVLNDARVGNLLRDQLVPYMSYRHGGMAVSDVIHFLRDALLYEALRGRLGLEDRFRQTRLYRERARFLSGGGGAETPLSELPVDYDRKQRVPQGKRARYAPSEEPLESVEAFLRVQRELVGDPELELFTPGSRLMRARYPSAPFEQLLRARQAEASKPFRVRREGDRAVVSSDRPVTGFVPILLHRIEGRWRVDLVETWKNLFYARDGNYVQVNAHHPYVFGLNAFGRAERHDVAPWPLGGRSLAEVVAALEVRDDALDHFLLAELLFRNAFLALDALQHYEQAIARAPQDPLFLETLGDRALYLGFPELAAESYRALGDRGTKRLARALGHMGHPEAESVTRAALERDPYDAEALALLQRILEASGRSDDAREVGERLAKLRSDPDGVASPLELVFDPPRPVLHLDAPVLVGDTPVYDHSAFAVTLVNRGRQPVQVERLEVTSEGTGVSSGLGDLRKHWPWPSVPARLEPGQSATLDRTWGFSSDTRHTHLSYVFDLCWRVGDTEVRRCRSQRVDLFPE